MKNQSLFILFIISSVLFTGCMKDELIQEELSGDFTLLSAGIQTRTVLTDDTKVLWTDGDMVNVNGVSSLALELDEPAEAVHFSFKGLLKLPYKALFPASIYKDAQTVTLPFKQTYKEATFAETASPMAAYQTEGNNLVFRHLCSVIKLNVNIPDGSDHSRIAYVEFSGRNNEQVCGDFAIDYENASLSGISEAENDNVVRYEVSAQLAHGTTPMYIVVPAAMYSNGYSFRLVDIKGHYMDISKKSSSELEPGKVYDMPSFDFVPTGTLLDVSINPFSNIRGTVRDDSGNPLPGVVVSDGVNCVRTGKDGRFAMESDESSTRFVFVSVPSGYSAPVMNGSPVFYKRLSEGYVAEGKYNFEFVLNKNAAGSDRYSLLIAADPQPRARTAGYDRIGYHSLDCCEDLYRDMREQGERILIDRPCYGIVLGDIVHNDMTLYDTYVTSGMSRMGFPTFNVLGNHDNDLSAPDDVEGARVFEEKFGPVNYSFNIGKIHYVVLDNLIMSDDGTVLTGEYTQGLRDDIWQWLQADLSYIDKDTPLMVCAHSPMFMQENGSERSRYAEHGSDYAALLSSYDKVYAWAGHIHNMFNFIYDQSSALRNIEVHTISRATGELWTNEYLAGGTPRGYLVVDVDGKDVSWKFRPLPYQTGRPVGNTPSYSLRAWNYDGNGVAVMKNGGCLDESYQMNVYPRHQYGDNYVYANIFMWDENWDTPKYISSDGTESMMTLVTEGSCRYDAAQKEIYDFYKANNASLSADEDYTWDYEAARRLFRIVSAKSSDEGRVEVTDRFGNVYSTSVSW
ncbi:MAG: calcineurin-like phosphoesterase C-terminal domain-containing protein [Bacteroidales bacterium]|nr:calcineurin-like phosphoesterase C-terminal domain-containing protein [Bacteroidales bacterium]